jgi:hypothetical protein
MNDMIDAVEHQKHAEAIAGLKTETAGLKEGLTEVKGGLRDLSSDMQTILSAVQNNNKSGLTGVITCGGLGLTFLIGFMTLVILPMQEATDKRRIEQDGKNKRQSIINEGIARESGRHEVSEEHYESWLSVHSTELKVLHREVSANAIKEARLAGELKGRIDCIENQVNAIDYTGPRGSTK